MKTLIGLSDYTLHHTGVRPTAKRVFLGTPVHIPPPRRRPMDECRTIPPKPLAPPSALSQRIAFLLISGVIAFGTAIMVLW